MNITHLFSSVKVHQQTKSAAVESSQLTIADIHRDSMHIALFDSR